MFPELWLDFLLGTTDKAAKSTPVCCQSKYTWILLWATEVGGSVSSIECTRPWECAHYMLFDPFLMVGLGPKNWWAFILIVWRWLSHWTSLNVYKCMKLGFKHKGYIFGKWQLYSILPLGASGYIKCTPNLHESMWDSTDFILYSFYSRHFLINYLVFCPCGTSLIIKSPITNVARCSMKNMLINRNYRWLHVDNYCIIKWLSYFLTYSRFFWYTRKPHKITEHFN